MSLTGTGIRIGNENDFGASLGNVRASATEDTTFYVFSNNAGYTLNPETGAATIIGSGRESGVCGVSLGYLVPAAPQETRFVNA